MMKETLKSGMEKNLKFLKAKSFRFFDNMVSFESSVSWHLYTMSLYFSDGNSVEAGSAHVA